MSYTVVPVAGASLIATNWTITAFTNSPDTIQATGAASNATRGDAIVVSGSTSNNGTYIVLDVIDADTVEVYPAPTVEAAAGTYRIHRASHRLDIVDEATVDADSIAAAMPDSRLFNKLIRVASDSSSLPFDIYRHLFRHIDFGRTSAGTTEFTSLEEVWYRDYDGSIRSTGSEFQLREAAGVVGDINVTLGELADASDIRSGVRGSVFLNGGIIARQGGATRLRARIYGSMITHDSFNVSQLGSDVSGVRVSNVISRGNFQVANPGKDTEEIYNVTTDGVFPMVGGDLGAGDKLTVARSTTTGVIVNTASELLIPGLELSNSVPATLLTLVNAAVNFLNPGENYSSSELFNSFQASTSRVTFTFNPRFVDYSLKEGPTPVSGALVTIEKLSDARVVNVVSATDAGTYTITINGEDHTFVAPTPATTSGIKVGLVSAINAGSQPVTAVAESSPPQFGDGIFIKSDVENVVFEIEITAEGTPGDLVLDPVATLGGAAVAGDDAIPGPITGSPFTTDANGRINTDGIELSSFVTYSFMGTANFFYRMRIEKAGFVTMDTTIEPIAEFQGDFPIRHARMGII